MLDIYINKIKGKNLLPFFKEKNGRKLKLKIIGKLITIFI